MPLTPEDVSNKRFTPVRLREGYDMGEVDQFLDEVEAELERLTKDNEDLRTKLSAAQQGVSTQAAPAPLVATPEAQAPPEPEVTTPEPEVSAEPEPEPEPIAPVASQAVQVTNATPEAGVQTIRVETVADASNAAARLLELASRNADQLVDGAKSEADKIIGEARTKAERLESESKANADQHEAEARGRAQMLDTETADRRTQLFGDLETERDRLAGEVDNLRAFEREYRSRLKTYFTQQLEALVSSTSADPSGGADTGDSQTAQPKRLRSVLGDDES
jgi:DivIVA domain-containing protein